ncbi:MAG: hypothetical protein WAX37_00830 [Minisyncoccia bacterium]
MELSKRIRLFVFWLSLVSSVFTAVALLFVSYSSSLTQFPWGMALVAIGLLFLAMVTLVISPKPWQTPSVPDYRRQDYAKGRGRY